MKKLKDFVFCDAVLTTKVVFYLVKVGISCADRQALRFVQSVASSSDFYFQDHTQKSQAYIEKCAMSIFDGVPGSMAMHLIRRQVVEIKWLAAFLRKNPPCLLNSAKINPAENRRQVFIQSVNVKNLSEK